MRIETPSLLKGKSTLAGVFWLKHLFQIIFYSVASYQPKCSHSLMFSFSLSLSLLSPSLSPFLPFSFFLFSFSLFLLQFWWLHLSQYLFKYGNKWKEIYVFFLLSPIFKALRSLLRLFCPGLVYPQNISAL